MYMVTWRVETWEDVPCDDGTFRTLYLPVEESTHDETGLVDSFDIGPLTEDYEEALSVVRKARQGFEVAA